jgi:hypothetical protein
MGVVYNGFFGQSFKYFLREIAGSRSDMRLNILYVFFVFFVYRRLKPTAMVGEPRWGWGTTEGRPYASRISGRVLNHFFHGWGWGKGITRGVRGQKLENLLSGFVLFLESWFLHLIRPM